MFSTSKNEKKRSFDPLADSIVEPQKNKKAIPSNKKSKPTNLKVFMPDGTKRRRKRLEKDRVQHIKIYQEMDSDELKEAIFNTFKGVHSYSMLMWKWRAFFT